MSVSSFEHEDAGDDARIVHHHSCVCKPGKEIFLSLDVPVFERMTQVASTGFCYELNGLFALLLRTLGFQVDMLSAGVAKPTGGFGPEFDHLTLLVHLEQDWLADVGFGESFRQPLRLQAGLTQIQSAGSYRLERDGGSWLYQQWDGSWKPAYCFRVQPHALRDFAVRCRYHQTSPQSTFTQKRVCSLATRSGRITLSDQRLITTREGERTERLLTDQEYRTILTEQFGIVLSPGA